MAAFPPHPFWQTLLDQKTNKPYYHNKQTNVTTYIVPDDLLTPAQVSRRSCRSEKHDSLLTLYSSSLQVMPRPAPMVGGCITTSKATSRRRHGHHRRAGKHLVRHHLRTPSSSCHQAFRPTRVATSAINATNATNAILVIKDHREMADPFTTDAMMEEDSAAPWPS